nr:MAG TPA: hypothetical protein [Bacteriophage sp.]
MPKKQCQEKSVQKDTFFEIILFIYIYLDFSVQ